MAITTTSLLAGARQPHARPARLLLAALLAAFAANPHLHAQTPVPAPIDTQAPIQTPAPTAAPTTYQPTYQPDTTASTAAPWTQPQPGPLLIGPGDLLNIEVFNTPELSNKVRVGQDGRIELPLAGTLALAGDTPIQAARTVESALKNANIMLDPHVTVFVAEYATQGVTLLGEVKAPGTYSLFGAHSLADALAAAGGLTATAGPTLTITHPNDREHPAVIDVNTPAFQQQQQRLSIDPGDTIVVSKARMIYVIGDVARPGAYYLENGQDVTVLRALAFASGANVTAAKTKASIVRPVGVNGAQTIPIDLNKIMQNKEKDIVLQASDVLVVPQSGLKVFLQYALPGATSAVTGAAATALIIR